MNKVILLGMVFNETDAPDFGSIRQSESGEYILLADDIPKLNSTLPEIAVTAGTNTLTVGTEVQPSSIEIKGRIKAAGG